MALTSIEIIALVFAILALVKIAVIVLFGGKKWLNAVGKPVYGNKAASTVILAVLTVLVFVYLLDSFSIVQIFAVSAFTALLIALGFVQYGKETLAWAQKIYKRNKMSAIEWLLIAAWTALSVWVILEIF